MIETQIHEREHWHRNPWVWLLIAIPTLTVAGCLLTIWLALSHPVELLDKDVSGAALPQRDRGQ